MTAVTLLLSGCGSRSSKLRLYFAVAPDESSGFTALRFAPTWGGVNQGPLRDENWTRVPVVAPSVDWAASDSAVPAAPVLLAEGAVPADDYLRVYVETPRVVGIAADGSASHLEAHIEPMMFPVSLGAGSTTDVVIDLIILPLPPWRGPGHGIFVKGAHPLAAP